MKVAIFGGSFDPVHGEHVNLVLAAIKELELDKVLVMPSFLAPHKRNGAFAGGEDRMAMCRLAFRNIPEVEVSDYELSKEGTSYSYLTCAWFKERYPSAERYFLVGADMLESFSRWRKPEEILQNVTLAACGRDGALPEDIHKRFADYFGCDFKEVHFTGKSVSSTEIRVATAFGKCPEGLDFEVYRYICERKLYSHPAILSALELEKPSRREHSYRVAMMACKRAKSLGIAEMKALLASALHDCGKNVPLDSPLLKGFCVPEGVPEPVLHQYMGAYLAEHIFGVKDEEILDAIRYHTSGRENMTTLEKLIFLSDLLEEERDFSGVERLRELFWKDLDECLLESLREQIAYLESTKKPVYPLTIRAYEWILGH